MPKEPKEPELPKPADLFIGVIDLFAVLIPGIIAAALIAIAIMADMPEANVFTVSGLVIAGWVLGHVLYGIGKCLDPLLYDRFYKPLDAGEERTRASYRKNDDLYRLAREMSKVPRRAEVPKGMMYQWAKVWLNSHNPESMSNHDRLEADSKLFRSLAVLLPFATAAIVSQGQWKCPAVSQSTFIVMGVLAEAFCLWRYCDLRNKAVRECYLNYVQLRAEPRPARATGQRGRLRKVSSRSPAIPRVSP
jgi:hypothetical protein